MASKSTVFLLLSAMSHLARTQHVEGPQIILSCAEVNCPTRPKVASNMCTVTNTTYSDVGVVKIQGAPSSLPGLTWVEAIAGDDTVAPRRFIKDFYLAADPQSKINSTGACALFFTKLSTSVVFRDDTRPITNSQGTCAQALSEECVAKMLQRARAVDLDGLSTAEACSQLQSVFEGKIDQECVAFLPGTTWTGVEATGMLLELNTTTS